MSSRYSALPPSSSSGDMSSPSACSAYMTRAVANGSVGAGYGPYSYHPPSTAGYPSNPRFSSASTGSDANSTARLAQASESLPANAYSSGPDTDDALHDPRKLDTTFTPFSARGWVNAFALAALVAGLLMLFLGYPIYDAVGHPTVNYSGYNLGGINGSGQIPDLNLRQLIDPDTPEDVFHRNGNDGKKYHLVFSDEFETEDRTFYPGDDPYWEAMDFHYWPTGDLEWYDPKAVTTKAGKLVFTMTQQWQHDLNFQSGMIQSWNKLCFTTGYIEVKVSLPGTHASPGYWPGIWTMGNLGRAGYGATTDGMWPYSYDACDTGAMPNQTNTNKGVDTSEDGPDGAELSWLPGQRTSACTCKGEDHPGPAGGSGGGGFVGRAAPEIDMLEAQIDVSSFRGQASQSFQVAPFDKEYRIVEDVCTIYDSSITKWNTYRGAHLQQACSGLSYFPDDAYNEGVTVEDDQSGMTVGMEYWSNPDNRDEGFITWFINGDPTWTLPANAIPARSDIDMSQRLIAEEPMYMVLNLGISPGFQQQDYEHMKFPAYMHIDYVRVYQRDGVPDDYMGCSPKRHPTKDYIEDHLNAYMNMNLTTWDQAGYSVPKNAIQDGC
ncbi:glycoside hydrolase family 16 protein [Schizophyllum fasciatum]